MTELSNTYVTPRGKIETDIRPLLESLRRLNKSLENMAKRKIMIGELFDALQEIRIMTFVENCKQRMRINF